MEGILRECDNFHTARDNTQSAACIFIYYILMLEKEDTNECLSQSHSFNVNKYWLKVYFITAALPIMEDRVILHLNMTKFSYFLNGECHITHLI